MNTTSYNILLFDLDGTLTDPKIGIVKSVQYALEKLGIKEDNEERIISFIGPSVFESFKKYYGLDDEPAWKGVGYYREYFGKKGMYENSVFEGIHDLLKKLYDGGKIMYVATAKPTVFAKEIIRFFNLQEYFTDVLGPDIEDKQQSKTTVIEKILAQNPGKDKKEFIMIGDRENDVVAAKTCGIDSIGVLFGYGTKEEIENAKPNYIAHTVLDLEKILL